MPDPSAARERMVARNYCVGLALPQDLDVSGWSEMGEFLSSCGRMQWIALAEPGLLTHRSLRELIYEDLYYRLHVLRLHAPPLRERLGDAELLASAVFEQYAY